MITNLTAVVTVMLVTNVTERFPTMTVPDMPLVQPGQLFINSVYYSKEVPVPDPKEKWVKTRITEVTVYALPQVSAVAKNERLISDSEVRFVLAPPGPMLWLQTTNVTTK